MGPGAPCSVGRLDQGPCREGRQPGDGAGGGRAARLAAGAVDGQGRGRRPLQAPAGPRAGPRPGRRRPGGVASHNLFDVAWALVLAEATDSTDRLDLEMLEGMAPAQAEAVRRRAGRLLLYAPVVAHDDFEAAIAYLVRRLDENAAPENFLHDLFALDVGSPAWEAQRARFEAAVADRHGLADRPRRVQDRSVPAPPVDPDAPFVNEPDTDFSGARQPSMGGRPRGQRSRTGGRRCRPGRPRCRRPHGGQRGRGRRGLGRSTRAGTTPDPLPGRRPPGRPPGRGHRRHGRRGRQDRHRRRCRGLRGRRLRSLVRARAARS